MFNANESTYALLLRDTKRQRAIVYLTGNPSVHDMLASNFSFEKRTVRKQELPGVELSDVVYSLNPEQTVRDSSDQVRMQVPEAQEDFLWATIENYAHHEADRALVA